MERGNRTVSEMDAARYLALCRESGNRTRHLRSLFTEHDGYWVQPHTVHPDVLAEAPDVPVDANAPDVPSRDDMLSLSVLEYEARKISVLDLVAVPALLQTPEYSEALLREGGAASERVIRKMVKVRQKRLSQLHNTGKRKLRFFIHENAVHLYIGDARIMEDQFLHLVFQASEAEPDVTIRIIPRATSPHAGMDGGFCLMEYEHQKPVVYLDHALIGVFVDRPGAVKHYRSILARLDKVAASEEETRALLAALV